MDISKYALFADVADTGNFTKSGERMGYTQPGVSHILKAMESEFGFPLFVRTKQGVVPTHNAEAILPLVRQLLAVNEQLEQMHSKLTADAQEVMEYLTSVLRGQSMSSVLARDEIGAERVIEKPPDEKERLKAAELLGKRYGLYTDKVDLDADAELHICIDYGESSE